MQNSNSGPAGQLIKATTIALQRPLREKERQRAIVHIPKTPPIMFYKTVLDSQPNLFCNIL